MDIKNQIKKQILFHKKGMRLDNFIMNALFSKYGYYYKKKPIGIKGDFTTSPEISQMFGEVIGLYLYYIWKTKINTKFNLIELGPGKATLFEDIVRTVSKYPNFLQQSKISFVEINEELKKIQKKKFNKSKNLNVKWCEKINFRSKNPSIIYSNEFFDCFPVRQFLLNKYWFEKYVYFNKVNDSFYLKNEIVNNKKLLSLLNSYKNEKIVEKSFQRNIYFEKICKHIKKNGGIFLTIDYGYFKNIKNFTLQALQNHTYSHVLENIGNKDISSHVNFNDLFNISKDNGLKVEEFCTQREFLIKHGILERKKFLSKISSPIIIEEELNKLINKNQMGDLFKCLVVSNL